MKKKLKKKRSIGFTLLELLIAVGIIVVVAAIIIGFITQSRAKASDARTQETLGSIRTVAIEKRNESGSFVPTFDPSGTSYEEMTALAVQQGLVAGEYAWKASTDEFVIVFPLKAEEGYWCIDSQGISKKVTGKPIGTPPYNCDNVTPGDGGTGDTSGTNTAPVITILGSDMVYVNASDTVSSEDEVIPGYPDQGATAYDTENGDLTGEIVASLIFLGTSYPQGTGGPGGSGGSSCGVDQYEMVYSVSDHSSPALSDQKIRYISVSHPSVGGYCGGASPGGDTVELGGEE